MTADHQVVRTSEEGLALVDQTLRVVAGEADGLVGVHHEVDADAVIRARGLSRVAGRLRLADAVEQDPCDERAPLGRWRGNRSGDELRALRDVPGLDRSSVGGGDGRGWFERATSRV